MCPYVSIRVYMNICMYVCRIYVRIYVCMCVHLHICVCMCLCNIVYECSVNQAQKAYSSLLLSPQYENHIKGT